MRSPLQLVLAACSGRVLVAAQAAPPPPPTYVFVETSYSYADASANCQSMGMQLASIHSAEQDAEAFALAAGSTSFVWFGLHDLTTEGTFEWSDGSAVDYTNWGDGQPDDWESNEDCGGYWPDTYTDGGWNDGPCDGTYPSICGVPPPPPASSSYVYVETSYSYADAVANCKSMGMQLASIHSAEQDAAAYALVGSSFTWIGLSDVTSEDAWVWSDGSSVDYTARVL